MEEFIAVLIFHLSNCLIELVCVPIYRFESSFFNVKKEEPNLIIDLVLRNW